MVQLRFENTIPSTIGEQPKSVIKFTNLAGLSPAEQWFYHTVQDLGLAAPYPELEPVKAALLTHLPQRTKRYEHNVPDPSSGESWLRSVLISGELLRLQPDPNSRALTVAVHPSSSEWKTGFEKISSPEFSTARHALGIDKHWMLVLKGITDAAPSQEQLMDALKKLALNTAECAVIHLKC